MTRTRSFDPLRSNPLRTGPRLTLAAGAAGSVPISTRTSRSWWPSDARVRPRASESPVVTMTASTTRPSPAGFPVSRSSTTASTSTDRDANAAASACRAATGTATAQGASFG